MMLQFLLVILSPSLPTTNFYRNFRVEIPFFLLITKLAASVRLLLMAALTTAWGLRLTYNFYRRGGYAWPPWTGEEDYRYAWPPWIGKYCRTTVVIIVYKKTNTLCCTSL